ncbi:YqaJ viral recombinase family protein [Bradyrhizobium sp. 2S1]|uniref:YqaJ viral recombinase family protein n=1 Tax=Bradyrhizobium sp. 2S1 TaxID=1404429 RepID=UPI0014085A97|nr:YqaJ viral recombinase family protein [Bradyrhizobium sp. 2S1]MCK7671497.1 YqaJ viral recombinase family protein [Bradyrhizobium sp. 2S1]
MTDTDTFQPVGAFAQAVVDKIQLGAVDSHPVTDRASWLAMRTRDITASDIASICGVGYRSALAVWAEKTGKTQPQADSPILQRGRWLEPAIWRAIEDREPSWQLRPAKVYLRSPSLRVGATPDALAVDPERKGFVLIQGKVVARPTFINDWLGGDKHRGAPEVPLGYQLQTLTETMLAEARFQTEIHPVLAALVVGDFTADLHMIPVQRHEGAEQRALATVKRFWEMIASGQQPALDPSRDHDVVRKLYPVADGTTIDLSGDNEIPEMVDERLELGRQIKEREDRRDEITTTIMHKIGDASFAVIAGGRRLSAKVTNVKEKVVAPYSFRSLREVKAL